MHDAHSAGPIHVVPHVFDYSDSNHFTYSNYSNSDSYTYSFKDCILQLVRLLLLLLLRLLQLLLLLRLLLRLLLNLCRFQDLRLQFAFVRYDFILWITNVHNM